MPGTMPFTQQLLGKNIFINWMNIFVIPYLRVNVGSWLPVNSIVPLRQAWPGPLSSGPKPPWRFLCIRSHASSFCPSCSVGTHPCPCKSGRCGNTRIKIEASPWPLTNHLTSLGLLCSARKVGILIMICQRLCHPSLPSPSANSP